jgi:hypothetical protein
MADLHDLLSRGQAGRGQRQHQQRLLLHSILI